jgi:hypothetical protein
MSHHTVGDEDEGKSSTSAHQQPQNENQPQNQHVGNGIINRKLKVKRRMSKPNYYRTPLPTSVAST